MAASTDPDFPSEWGLTYPELLTTTFASSIWRVELPDGAPAVVKVLRDFPDVWDELRGAYFLDWRDGTGAIRLLASQGRMMLLEHGGDRLLTDVIDAEGDNSATEIAADVLRRMHTPSDCPAPHELQPLRERFSSLFAKAAADERNGLESLYRQTAEIAAQLLDDAHDQRPMHADLHHENIIFGPRGWLAIDPKGVLGDPGFDAGNLFFNPLSEQTGLCLKAERIAFMAEAFGKALDQSPARILDHAIAYGCLSASWHAEDGNDEDEAKELGVVAAIRSVRIRI